MGRVIRNQRKGRGSIFSECFPGEAMHAQEFNNFVQRPILVSIKLLHSFERLTIQRGMDTFVVWSKR